MTEAGGIGGQSPATSTLPRLDDVVLVCLACHHWQCDAPPRVVRDLGPSATLWAVGEEHVEHLKDCPGAGGRVKVLGQWVDRPQMSHGTQADGVVGASPLPRWWVWR